MTKRKDLSILDDVLKEVKNAPLGKYPVMDNKERIKCHIKQSKVLPYDMKIKVWTNDSADRMFIQTMSKQHLINAINKFNKNGCKYYRDRRWIPILKEELENRS